MQMNHACMSLSFESTAYDALRRFVRGISDAYSNLRGISNAVAPFPDAKSTFNTM